MVKADRSTLTRIYRATNFQAGGGRDKVERQNKAGYPLLPPLPSTPRYCDPLGRVDRADRLSGNASSVTEISSGDLTPRGSSRIG